MKTIREFVKENTNDRDEPVSKFMVEQLLSIYGKMVVMECVDAARLDPNDDGCGDDCSCCVDTDSIMNVSNLIK